MITNVYDEATKTRRVDGTRNADEINSINYLLTAENGVTISGFGGNDNIRSEGSNDTIYGDGGNDTLDGGGGSNKLFGGNGNDFLIARMQGQGNVLKGDAGNDHLDVYVGLPAGNYYATRAIGGAGTDTLRLTNYTGNNEAVLYANLYAGRFGFIVDGKTTNSGFVGTMEKVEFYGKARYIGNQGKSSARGSSSDDFLDGQAGADTLEGGTGADKIIGDVGNDFLLDSTFAAPSYLDTDEDILKGGDDADILFSRGGEDQLLGGAGNDHLFVTRDPGLLDGGAGADYIGVATRIKQSETDLSKNALAALNKKLALIKFNANEIGMVLTDMKGALFKGGTGTDTLSLSGLVIPASVSNWTGAMLDLQSGKGSFEPTAGPTSVKAVKFQALKFENFVGTSGNDEVFGKIGRNKFWGGGGDDYLNGKEGNDTLYGNNGKDRLIGGAGDDKLFGQGGKDSLFAGRGKDTLNGGAGDDFLFSTKGADTLTGGKGADTFSLSSISTSGAVMHITDFRDFGKTQDVIDLEDWSGVFGTRFSDLKIEAIGKSDFVPKHGKGHVGTLVTVAKNHAVFLEGISTNQVGADDFIF